METSQSATTEAKNVLRRDLLAGRRSRPAAARRLAAQRNEDHLRAVLTDSQVVCAYLPLPSEPLTSRLLDQLVDAGTLVLVPVVTADAALDWCRYPCRTEPGAFGIAEPVGPRLGAAAIRTADAVLVPALAVDRAGRRLGRGGGHYDRSLTLLQSSKTPLQSGTTLLPSGTSSPAEQQRIAVLFDDELLDALPVQDHDQPVTAAVRPSAGLLHFPS